VHNGEVPRRHRDIGAIEDFDKQENQDLVGFENPKEILSVDLRAGHMSEDPKESGFSLS
jgi:hypothetical protein